MHIVFWQNIQSPHQSALIRALKNLGHEVTLVSERGLPSEFRAQGWEEPDFGCARLIVGPDDGEIRRVLDESPVNSVQIFTAARAFPMVWKAFRQCPPQHLVGLFSETGDWQGIKGLLRLARGRWDCRRDQARVSFVLAIGQLGVDWFRRCGWPSQKIFPFGYFTEPPTQKSLEQSGPVARNDRLVQIVFLGRCIRLKGVDLLLQALSSLLNLPWELTIIGGGPEENTLSRMTQTLGMGNRVHFRGAMVNSAARQVLASSDLLVLPSRRKDGWGAVINEALMLGVPAVCSDHCGAADLLRCPERGEVFPAGSVGGLREVLARRIATGPPPSEQRTSIRRWSQNISGETAANYLLEVVQAANTGRPKPIPHWLG